MVVRANDEGKITFSYEEIYGNWNRVSIWEIRLRAEGARLRIIQSVFSSPGALDLMPWTPYLYFVFFIYCVFNTPSDCGDSSFRRTPESRNLNWMPPAYELPGQAYPSSRTWSGTGMTSDTPLLCSGVVHLLVILCGLKEFSSNQLGHLCGFWFSLTCKTDLPKLS